MSRLTIFSLCLQVVISLAIPIFLFVHLRQGASLRSFADRLGWGLAGDGFMPENSKCVWFHAASLGEVKQIEEVARVLRSEHGYDILVTTFTHAGAKWVRDSLPFATHKYAPLDIGWVLGRYVHRFRPTMLVLVEGDIWPNMIKAANNNEAFVALLNARSSRSRKRFANLYRKIVARIDLITVPSATVAQEFLHLGATQSKVKRVESLKTNKLATDPDLVQSLGALAAGRKVWAAASTHRSDEELIFQVLKGETAKRLLVWAPRHLNRVFTIEKQLGKMGLKAAKRSGIDDALADIDVLILDSLGELGSVFEIADAVYLGGGQGNEGGHNPFEPAAFGLPIISGTNIENHKEAFNAAHVQCLVRFASTAEDVLEELKAVFTDSAARTDVEQLPTEADAVTRTVELLLQR